MLTTLSANFTPLSASVGGLMIGGAASYLLRSTGRIFGISGIVRTFPQSPWRQAALGGLFVGGNTTAALMGATATWQGVMEATTFNPAIPMVAGFLVGAGTTFGSGCTSGHGVCGLARLSKRSLVAVPTFMGFGMLTASLCARIDPLLLHSTFLPTIPAPVAMTVVFMAGLALIAKAYLSVRALDFNSEGDSKKSVIASSMAGTVFGSGLIVSGMCNPAKVLGFLDLTSAAGWDPSLAFVMGSALAVTIPTFQFKPEMPSLRTSWELPTAKDITLPLVGGSMLFGVGWGIYGFCPGPGIIAISSGSIHAMLWCLTMWFGMRVAAMVMAASKPIAVAKASKTEKSS